MIVLFSILVFSITLINFNLICTLYLIFYFKIDLESTNDNMLSNINILI
jgi:hypothetical protein